MTDAIAIIIGIIFILIIGIIIVVAFYYNRTLAPNAFITTFGLPIIHINEGLYMSIENIAVINQNLGQDIFPVMSIKPVVSGSPEPTEGWILERPNNNMNGDIVTFFNPANSGYMNYEVNSDNNQITTPYIRMDGETKPPDPTNDINTQKGWFQTIQVVVNRKTVTQFKSLNPGPINGEDQYIITTDSLPNNPGIRQLTIGVPTNGNNNWIVG